jgi:hypothetical protein
MTITELGIQPSFLVGSFLPNPFESDAQDATGTARFGSTRQSPHTGGLVWLSSLPRAFDGGDGASECPT